MASYAAFPGLWRFARRNVWHGLGELSSPQFGVDLGAVGLTDEEAKGCAALLAQGEVVEDAPMPARDVVDDVDQGWRALGDEAGALRGEHTLSRTAEADTEHPPQTRTLLPEPRGPRGLVVPRVPLTTAHPAGRGRCPDPGQATGGP